MSSKGGLKRNPSAPSSAGGRGSCRPTGRTAPATERRAPRFSNRGSRSKDQRGAVQQPYIMTMEIPNRDHPHLIGRGGANISKIMLESNLKIHFPDENLGKTEENSGKKVNLVTLTGSKLEDLELGRSLLRKSMPVNICVDLDDLAMSKLTNAARQEMKKSTGVDVKLMEQTLWLKASESNTQDLQRAVQLVGKLIGKNHLEPQMLFNISPEAFPKVRGGAKLNLRRIAREARITVNTSCSDGILLEGEIPNIVHAWKMIVGSLPLEVKLTTQQDFKGCLDTVGRETDCVVCRSDGLDRSFIVSTYERNAGNLYKVCLLLMGKKDVQFPIEIPLEYEVPAEPVFQYRHTCAIISCSSQENSCSSASGSSGSSSSSSSAESYASCCSPASSGSFFSCSPPPETWLSSSAQVRSAQYDLPAAIKIDLGCFFAPKQEESDPFKRDLTFTLVKNQLDNYIPFLQ